MSSANVFNFEETEIFSCGKELRVIEGQNCVVNNRENIEKIAGIMTRERERERDIERGGGGLEKQRDSDTERA